MFYVDKERWASKASLAGALVWVVLAAFAGSGRAPLGVIELLFLFAPLVAVPLGLAVIGVVSASALPSVEAAAQRMQPFAALSIVLAFWRGPGALAGFLAAPWAIVCSAIALSGLAGLRGRLSTATVVGSIARIDLGVAGGFLLLSRFGIRLQSQEPIVLLTAVHFHYSGFATSAIALAGFKFAQRSRSHPRLWQLISLLVAFLPFAIAVGFVFSPILKVVSAPAFAVAVVALAFLLLLEARNFHVQTARLFIGVAAAFVFAGMALAATYAIGEYLHRSWLTIPRMASTHGWMNALGFVMPALLGCLAELGAHSEYSARNQSPSRLSGKAQFQLAEIVQPTFAARDFYDI